MKKTLFFLATPLFFAFIVMVVSVSAQNPTIPTRTPTPGAQTPPPPTTTATQPSTGTTPPAGDPPPGSTAVPATTMTNTPESSFYPTAVPCSDQPTIFALNASFINVRTGPDTRYSIIESLAFREVRPIVGRDAVARWWLIRLNERQTGWVADDVVEVHGNTVNVPIVAAPPLNGATVTPGATWQPTAPPQCATPATLTPSARATATTNSDTLIVAPLATVVHTAYPAATSEPTSQTSVLSAAVTPTATATAITLPTSIAAVPPPTQPPTPAETNIDAAETDYSGLLLVGAALLLVGGTAVFIIKRR